MADLDESEESAAAALPVQRIRVEASVSVALPAAAAAIEAGSGGYLLVMSPDAARELGQALLIAAPPDEVEAEEAPAEPVFMDA